MNDGKQDGGRKRYDEAFKRSAVELCQRDGKSASRVAAKPGVNVQSLQQWRRQYAVVPPAGTERTVEAPEAENRRLRRELALAFEQWDIQKTLGILSICAKSFVTGSGLAGLSGPVVAPVVGVTGHAQRHESATKREVLARLRRSYAKAGAEYKHQLLDQAVALLGYHRKAAIRALRAQPPPVRAPAVLRGRPRDYEPARLLPVLSERPA